jgi:flagellar biosynthetic protein FlhB
MADDRDESSKTEEPTAKRLEEARKRGQVAFSREVGSWAVLGAATIGLVALAPTLKANTIDMMSRYFGGAHAMPTDLGGVAALAQEIVLLVALAVGPLTVGMFIAGIAAGAVQVGWMIAPEAMAPKFSKISPLSGFSRLFSSAAIIELLKGLLKLAIVGGMAWYVAAPEFERAPLHVLREPAAALVLLSELVFKLLIAVLAVLTVIAIVDVVYQHLRLRKELRMTRTEVRDEYKEQEGDPMVKAKLRQIRQERSRRRMMQAVPKADVVITNPTHYAVALRYDRETMAAPMLVAKGVDGIARRIREIAEASEVPIVENPPLARALHAAVDLDQEIPEEHYKAVAEIIGYVWRLRGGARRAEA